MFLREPTHILLVVLVLILLFGAKRLPDSARALGRSLRIFKGELKNGNEKDSGSSADPQNPDNPSAPNKPE